MAALKTVTSAAGPAIADSADTGTAYSATATGRLRRKKRAAQATAPNATSRTNVSGLWSGAVTATMRIPPAAATSSPGRSRRCQRGTLAGCPARSVITQSVRPGTRVDPRPKSLRMPTEGDRALDRRPYRRPQAQRQTRRMIESQNLTKSFGGRTVVNDVSFRVEPGTVTGFLGANGAGKTTTLRMLSGLSEPDSGQAVVLGGRYRDLANPGRRVGILLDAAAQHDGRRGREALLVSAQMIGVDPRRVDALLDLVGLDRSAARKRVRHYSLGMRQRLGLAHALLGDPQVLILDEPANGLDPPGMRWMRELLRDFADRGGSVLLSSHLLHEVEALADRLVIIDVGRIV